MIERLPHEDELEFFFRVATKKVDKEIDVDWMEIKDFFGIECTSDHLRKMSQGIAQVYKYYQNKPNNDESSLDAETEKKLLLQKERYKLSSEKHEVNKWIREQSRSEVFQEKLIEAISNTKPLEIPDYIKAVNTDEVGAILPLADQHYGKKFTLKGLLDETINEYSVEIFESRMWNLLNQVIHIVKKEGLNHINVSNMGDAIDGMLRASQLQKLQLGMVDQVIGYSEFMAAWLNELSNYVRIDYFSVLGNHAETRVIQSGRGDFPEENMERLITWYLETKLKDNPNIKIHTIGNYAYHEIAGIKTLFIHGQYEKNLENSIKDYMITYGKQVDLLISGHLHSTHTKTVGTNGELDIQFIQCPSLVGVDDYAARLKKSARPGCKLLIVERGVGVSTEYNLRFK